LAEELLKCFIRGKYFDYWISKIDAFVEDPERFLDSREMIAKFYKRTKEEQAKKDLELYLRSLSLEITVARMDKCIPDEWYEKAYEIINGPLAEAVRKLDPELIGVTLREMEKLQKELES